MNESYNQKPKKSFSRDAIIGLGEESFRKNYYPELQEKIIDLERINSRNMALISTIPDILLVSNLIGDNISFEPIGNKDTSFSSELLSSKKVMKFLSSAVTQISDKDDSLTKEFKFKKGRLEYYFEARLKKSGTNEILIMIRNMTDRILLEHRLRDLVERDPLTGLYNRRKFEEIMKSYNRKPFKDILVLSFDINGLKFINDTLGHLIGDQVIVAGANIINRVFEKHGIIARIGGDEFGIIISGLKEDNVEQIISHLLKEVESHNDLTEHHGLSFSFGYSYHQDGIVNMEYLFQEADNNMYQNKLLMKDSIRGTFVKTFMKALEAKDFVSEGHVVRMEKMAVEIGNALGLHRDQIDRLILLTKFHDIGKIGIPDSILKKPMALNDDEWKVMKTHCTIGERIALEAVEIKDIAHLILKHHERWDGLGYPLGLAKEIIPMECRILAIVDTFDAMTNDRPYRTAMSVNDAINEIVNCSGTQFDPSLVKIFTSILPHPKNL